jgi:hypothetical protein
MSQIKDSVIDGLPQSSPPPAPNRLVSKAVVSKVDLDRVFQPRDELPSDMDLEV